MRIAFLSASGAIGGAERCLLDLIGGLRRSRPDWALHLVCAEDGPLISQAEGLGAPSTVVAFPRALGRLGDAPRDRRHLGFASGTRALAAIPSLVVYAMRLRATLRRLAPDVVHANGLKMDVLSGLAAPRSLPIVWHLHDFVGRRPLARRLLRALVGRAAAIVANSRLVADDARAALREDGRVHTVPNGVDLETFRPAGPALDLDALAGLPPAAAGVVRVGLIATMAHWKGHELFLRALALVPRELRVRAYVIGGPIYATDGSQRSLDDLRDVAQRLGLSSRVGFTGFVDQPAAAMRALDVVVHASTTPEPFGLVIAEAMACGRVVVATETTGAAEFTAHGRDVLTFPAGDARALAERVAQAADPKRREQLGRQARETAVKSFNRERVTETLISLYRDVASVRA